MRMRLLLLTIVATLALCAAAIVPARGVIAQQEPACSKIGEPATLQGVINGARAGDVICLTEGVFRGPVTFESKRDITLRGNSAGRSIIAGGDRDSLLIFNSERVTIENLTLFYGHPSNAYVWRSTDVDFRRVDAGGGALGIHFDVGSRGRIIDSFVYAMDGDGILTRRNSNVTIERNWVFNNGGVGVSTVGPTANTTILRNIISDNEGPGVFAGATPCALLPPGFVEVPECYLDNLAGYVTDANVILDTNVIQASGSTGIVLFPGTRGTMKNNRIWRNELSGLFVWGGTVTSEGDEYDANEEHAIEMRAFPDPLLYPEIPTGQRIRAVGIINNNTIKNTVVLPETGTLGGGFLAQGANVDVINSRIYGNRGIGVSYVNTSLGRVTGNQIYDNRGSAICTFRAGNVMASDNVIRNNSRDGVGVCHETTP